jgi:hypothetical protein
MTKTEKNCAQEEHHFEEGHDFRGRAQLQSERRNFRGEGCDFRGKARLQRERARLQRGRARL